jgi:hypothetical protein
MPDHITILFQETYWHLLYVLDGLTLEIKSRLFTVKRGWMK